MSNRKRTVSRQSENVRFDFHLDNPFWVRVVVEGRSLSFPQLIILGDQRQLSFIKSDSFLQKSDQKTVHEIEEISIKLF